MTRLRTETIELTPEYAVRLLENPAPNRLTDQGRLASYARDIAEDRWTFNGETIKVNQAGQMFDGKHRCMAVVRAEKSIQTLIAWDAEEANVDMGRPRTYADVLSIGGARNSRNVAAAVRSITLWNNGSKPGLEGQYKPTLPELEQTLKSWPEITDILHKVNQVRPFIAAQPSVLALCYWLFTQAGSADLADKFFEDVAQGVGLSAGNAALTLRNRLTKEQLARRGAIPVRDSSALIIMAWNAYSENRPIQRLQLPNPLTKVTYPEVRSLGNYPKNHPKTASEAASMAFRVFADSRQEDQ